MRPAVPRGRVWFEVWPRGWGFYEVWECDELLSPGRKYSKGIVWGLRRATKRAEALQEAHDTPPAKPDAAFSTRETADIEAAKRRERSEPS